jgi:TLD
VPLINKNSNVGRRSGNTGQKNSIMSLEMVENQHLPNTYLIESYSPNFAPSPDEMFANINEKNKNESFMFLMKHNG